MRQEVTIERLGHLGDGIAPGPVFADRTLPGEVVSGVPEDGHLRDIRIVTPSPDRVAAPCPHYRTCGGCRLQHASDPFVARWKEEVVRAALAAQGLTCDFRAMAVSPPGSRRRATLAARRTKKGALVGFHGRGSDTITAIPRCLLLEPALIAGLPVAEALAVAGASRKGALDIAMTTSEAGLDVAVQGGKDPDGPLQALLGQLAGAHGLARLAWNGEVVAMSAPPVQRFGRAGVVPPPGAFLQATRAGEAALLADVQEITQGARKVADLFAGSGTFALPLTEAAEVHAAEGDPAMVAALEKGWRQAGGLHRLTAETRDLFRRPLMAEDLAGFDAAVIDPPRAGAAAQIAELAASDIPVIAHVSCNPVTFARDARVLTQAGFALEWLRVVDQFRWSAHTELVAAFSRA